MNAKARATIGLTFYAWLLCPALLDAQTHSPEGPSLTGDSVGELVVAVENGWSDLEHQIPVTADTRFQWRVTKAFTGMALLKLWENGRIGLDRAVQEYAPMFPQQQGIITPRLLAARRGPHVTLALPQSPGR